MTALLAYPSSGFCASKGGVNGFLFSVPLQVEGFCQIQCCFVQRQAAHGGPQVQHVALGGAVGLEALAYLLIQMNGRKNKRVGSGGIKSSCPLGKKRLPFVFRG